MCNHTVDNLPFSESFQKKNNIVSEELNHCHLLFRALSLSPNIEGHQDFSFKLKFFYFLKKKLEDLHATHAPFGEGQIRDKRTNAHL